jgi:hypothetical protein
MNVRLYSQLLVVLSICYGLTIALLGVFGSAVVTEVAVVGALVIGGLWAVLGVLSSRKDSQKRDSSS